VPMAVIIMGIFGYLLDLFVLRRMFGQSQIAVVILTIALGFVLRFFAGLIWGHEPKSLESPIAGQDVRFGGLVLGLDEVMIIVVTVVLTVALYFYFNLTRLGVAMQAASQNQLAAYYMGIPVKLIFSLIWAISAGTAAAAGILLAPVTLIDINMGLAVALKAFAAAVLGGFGSIPGALVGGIVIGLIELYAGATLPDGFKDTAPYIVLLVMLAVRPQGLFGTMTRKKV
jgi:branched-chain amino acid transport system permease protein